MKKKSLLFLALFLLATIAIKAQDWPRLNITVKNSFGIQASIYVEPIMPDYIMAVDILKSTFTANGYKIVNDRKDADFILIFNYKDRDDTKCGGGRAMKKLEGKIYNAKGTGETMVLFNFSQTAFETKCTLEVFTALAKNIKTEMLKK